MELQAILGVSRDALSLICLAMTAVHMHKANSIQTAQYNYPRLKLELASAQVYALIAIFIALF